jgi:hypothetical protein
LEGFKNSCPERKKNFHSDIVLKFLKRLDGWNDFKKQLSREKEKFSLRHCTEVLKTARWMERFKKKQLSGEKEKFSLRHCTDFLF